MTDILDAKATQPLRGGPCFSLKHRIQRLIWNLVWALFASWTPPPLHRYRIFLLQLFGAKVDRTAHVYGSARIWLPRNLTMDAHSCLGPKVTCYCMANVHLEPYAIVSQGAHLCTGMHDVDDPNFQLITKPIKLCSHSWVAAEAFIGPGVIIAARSVIGARAVVFKNTEINMIYIGNPAQPLRIRKH